MICPIPSIYVCILIEIPGGKCKLYILVVNYTNIFAHFLQIPILQRICIPTEDSQRYEKNPIFLKNAQEF